MWIFACYDHDRVSAMSMFSNTAYYLSEEHAIDTVRSRFSISENQIVKFVKPDIWNAPNAVATPTSFNVDMQKVNGSILKYLESFNYQRSDILNALNVSSAIPNPKLGILLICVDMFGSTLAPEERPGTLSVSEQDRLEPPLVFLSIFMPYIGLPWGIVRLVKKHRVSGRTMIIISSVSLALMLIITPLIVLSQK
jgi:hypothetical protein